MVYAPLLLIISDFLSQVYHSVHGSHNQKDCESHDNKINDCVDEHTVAEGNRGR
jgi:hypothetical protein